MGGAAHLSPISFELRCKLSYLANRMNVRPCASDSISQCPDKTPVRHAKFFESKQTL
jgi:hypothetical protein